MSANKYKVSYLDIDGKKKSIIYIPLKSINNLLFKVVYILTVILTGLVGYSLGLAKSVL